MEFYKYAKYHEHFSHEMSFRSRSGFQDSARLGPGNETLLTG